MYGHLDKQIGLPARLHCQITSMAVHRQKWCHLPNHKPQRGWVEKIVLGNYLYQTNCFKACLSCYFTGGIQSAVKLIMFRHLDKQTDCWWPHLPARLHCQITSMAVHRQKWCHLPNHKPQRGWVEKIVLGNYLYQTNCFRACLSCYFTGGIQSAVMLIMLRHLDKQTDFWRPGLPAYTANSLHWLSTAKNGATYPPIKTREVGQKKLYCTGKILPPPSCFLCFEWVTSTTFHYMWTNSEAQTNQLST